MIAKRITSSAEKPRMARLVKYMVAAEGQLDPRSWTRTADYMLASGISTRGEKVGGVRVTNCNTDDPAAATTLIEATQAANTRSNTDKTYHMVFSFPPGEEPPLETLHKIEDELVASIGFADHQRISAVHIDTDHYHVHVAINKVHPTGYQNIEPYYDKKKLMETCERLEIEYGLQRTNHGLTGERSHAKLTGIRLEPQRQYDSRERKYFHQSHLLSTAYKNERENNHGMPELPGGNVARIERGYSELLPGDARNNLLSQGKEHPDGLRRAGPSVNGNGTRLNDKAAQAEAHSGVDTLTGFVSRELAHDLDVATSWKEIHETLAKHGLEIKPRGAGLVIGNGKLWVRASQCDRALSMKSLTDRLGPYQRAARHSVPPYQPKPRQNHPSSTALFEQYQRDQLAYRTARDNGMKQITYESQLLEYQLKRWYVAQRLILKLSKRSPARSAMTKIINLQTRLNRQNNWKTITAKRKKLYVDTVIPCWAVWLSDKANSGDAEALAVLRSRQDREQTQGDYLTATNPEETKHIVFPKLRPDTARKGNVTYNTNDGGVVIDRKESVQSFKTTAGAAQLSMELAATRFKGQALIVEGSEQFKRDVAVYAGAYRTDVRFSDPEMEKLRKAAITKIKTNEVDHER